MAIDICSEISSLSISPRISFSHDLNQLDQQDHHYHHQNGQHFDRNNPVSDFDFCVLKNDSNFIFEFPSADELFSDGKILPVEIKTTSHHQKPVDLAQQNDNSTKKIVQLKELLSLSYDTDEEEEREVNDNNDTNNSNNNSDDKKSSRINYMSFWKFRRSNSLNLEKIKSLHFISRSNSTGSTQPTRKPILQKQKSASASSSSSSKAKNRNEYKRSSSFSSFHNHRNSNNVELSSSKSYPRKGNNGNNNICGSQYYGNTRVSPILNLPQPYISRVTISFFGFGSLFCNGKVKNKKK